MSESANELHENHPSLKQRWRLWVEGMWPESAAAARTVIETPAPSRRVYVATASALAIILVLLAMAMHGERDSGMAYWLLPAATFLFWTAAIEKFGWRRSGKASLASGLAVMAIWWSTDSYVEQWSDAEKKLEFIDYRYRLGDRLHYREVIEYQSDNEADWSYIDRLWAAEGAFTESMKKHGEWKYSYHDPQAENFIAGSSRESKFFWYDEEISEGEWHLRNK